jgi:hypothetical protein
MHVAHFIPSATLKGTREEKLRSLDLLIEHLQTLRRSLAEEYSSLPPSAVPAATTPSMKWRDLCVATTALRRDLLRRVQGLFTMKTTLYVLASMLVATTASATPSTTFWAPSVATCQPAGTPHVTYDTYFGRGTPPPNAGSPVYPIDTGLTMGVLPFQKVQAEVGYDLLLPSSNPVFAFLNGKVCTPESSLFKGSPSIGGGIYNVGFKTNVTNYNVAYAMAQKTLPFGGYIAGGFYHGTNDVLFTNSEGKIVKTGAMVGWSSPDINVGVKGLKKIDIIADVQTGKNILGAGGVGAEVYFNDYVDMIVGPVFFLDSALQPGGASRLWTTQLDVDIPLGR